MSETLAVSGCMCRINVFNKESDTDTESVGEGSGDWQTTERRRNRNPEHGK